VAKYQQACSGINGMAARNGGIGISIITKWRMRRQHGVNRNMAAKSGSVSGISSGGVAASSRINGDVRNQ